MKTLKEYIKEYFNEKLIVNKDYKHVYAYAPTSFDELRKIIEDRYKEQGPGTEKDPIDFNDIDVSKINSFYHNAIGLFDDTKFKYIDISEWDVLNVENMRYMFYKCKNLESIGDISNWNVSNVEDIRFMFYKCINLTSIGDISNWDVSKVKNMSFMLFECNNLESIGDISKWDVSNVKSMTNMFKNSGITNIPSWYE